MGGRLQVFVLVVVVAFLHDPAVAAGPYSQFSGILNELASRCRSVAGEQAAADVINLLHSLMTCTDFEQLYAESVQYLQTGNTKGLLEMYCRKKDNFLTCARQGLQKIERCLLPQEKEFAEAAEQILQTTGNFFCKNIDDLVSIAASQEEVGCAAHVGERAEECRTQTLGTSDGGQHNENFEAVLESKEKMCQMTEEILQCVNEVTGKCKDSTFLRFVNSFFEELLSGISCPNRLGTNGVAGLLALNDDLLGLMAHLVLGLVAPHVLHL